VKHEVRLSDRAAKDLDRLDRDARQRVLNRLDQLAEAPFDPRFSIPLTNAGGLRRSRVGGWRIIFSASTSAKTLEIVTVERRGQVYGRM
jgi:mRNA-degrading endonuclease RelE of RelBE toxin-antitoxin system